MYFEKRIPLFTALGFREEALPLLKNYVDLLWKSNEELNLFSRQMSFEELIDNHVIDCLLPLLHFPPGLKTVADFGSGGGLPAVICALQFSGTQFHLYEKSIKKQDFLQRCKSIAPNIHVHGLITPDLPAVDLVVCRAFKPIDVILELSRDYYNSLGKYFLLKGRKEKIDEEVILALKKFKNLKVEIKPLKSPVLEVERHLVLI
ncbi:MAG: 16S rRNA (guanine(527)-N(7))-methyltransferase RsmG [Pseudobdellovibrionaceae bacterium]|jgi:16S rRNA (guanine527-N7)-methyltransferase